MKFSADFDTDLDNLALRAQQGDTDAQAELLEKYKNLIYKIVAGRGITPYRVGKDNFYDLISELQLHLLTHAIPGYDPEKGHFRNLLYSSITNFLNTLFTERTEQEEATAGPLLSLEEPTGEDTTLQDIIPDYSTTGVTPEVEILLNSAKQMLSPVDRMILDYYIIGYKAADIAKMFATQEVKTPRGGIYSPHDITMRYNKVIKPALEEVFPEEMRKPYGQPGKHPQYQVNPPYEPVYPAYRINPETGERTLIGPSSRPLTELTEEEKALEQQAGRLSLKKKASCVLDVLDYIRIHLLYD